MKAKFCLFWTLLAACQLWAAALKIIENSVATPEIIYTPGDVQFEPICRMVGARLDLLFLIDSSDSLKEEFSTEVAVAKKIIEIVAVSADATRVGLVKFSGHQYTEFHFNTYTTAEEILLVLDNLRMSKGVTYTGAALEYCVGEFTAANGMRGPEVPKLLFLLSDGRAHDAPKDKIWADKLKQLVPGLEIWAYGTGNYPAIESLMDATGSRENIVTKRDLQRLPDLFEPYKGSTVCTEVPVCIQGSDKPLDLLFVVDASESVEGKFHEQVNFLHRVLNNLNVHPKATKVALIHYSDNAHLLFDFNRFNSTRDVRRYIQGLDGAHSTTRTDKALNLAFETFTDAASGVRENVNKVAVVLTDGHSQYPPDVFARRLTRIGQVVVYAVAVSSTALVSQVMLFRPNVDETELEKITDMRPEYVFTKDNLETFEASFISFIGFGCPEINCPSCHTATKIIDPISIHCDANAVHFEIRTSKPFNGWLYVKEKYDDGKCIVRGGGEKSASLTIVHGSCGMKRQRFQNETFSGYRYEVTAAVQFHDEFVTGADVAKTIQCDHPISTPLWEDPIREHLPEFKCTYTLGMFSRDGCIALDARVGDGLYHRWQCDNSPDYGILVHDCFAESERQTIPVLNSDGCQSDPYVVETPLYDTMNRNSAYRDWAVYKFPDSSSLKFRCQISICKMNSADSCKYLVATNATTGYRMSEPPQCIEGKAFNVDGTSSFGFVTTIEVETRRLNVLENDNTKNPLKPEEKYCIT